MSKRAEEAALKAFPDMKLADFMSEDEYTEAQVRTLSDQFVFRMGYKQAERDTLERAIEWLRPRLRKMTSPGLTEGILEEFRNGMK